VGDWAISDLQVTRRQAANEAVMTSLKVKEQLAAVSACGCAAVTCRLLLTPKSNSLPF
jgi:hypothetical protein